MPTDLLPRSLFNRLPSPYAAPVLCEHCGYMADVLDPDGHGWVRYDANSNGAIGWDVGAPTGRVQHEHHSYYAILLAYVRVHGGPSDLAES